MQRIIIIVAVLYLAWRVLAAMGRRTTERGKGAEDFSRFNARSRDRRRSAKERQAENVELVACAHCGTFIPSDRALGDPQGVVCCSHDCQERLQSDTEATQS